MHRVWRVLVMAAAAVVAFFWAVDVMGDAAERDCVLEAAVVHSYAAQLDGAPLSGDTDQQLTVTHGGRPVTGERVCLRVQSAGAPTLTARAEGTEVAPGRFQVALSLPRPGMWEGRVLVIDRSGQAVAVPLSFEVAP